MKLGRNLRILTCFWRENPFAFLLSFIPSFQRLLFYKKQSGETEEPVSLKTSFGWWINQPRRLAYLWRCFLFCEMMVFFVRFDVVVNCGWKPIRGQERRGFAEASSDGVCRWWAVKVVLGFSCSEALGGLGMSFSEGWVVVQTRSGPGRSFSVRSSFFSLSPLIIQTTGCWGSSQLSLGFLFPSLHFLPDVPLSYRFNVILFWHCWARSSLLPAGFL